MLNAVRVATSNPKPASRISRQRREAYRLNLSASDIWDLQQRRDSQKSSLELVAPYIPILTWALWLIVGTVYYCQSDEFGFIYGFYMSVNIGWSLGWKTPLDTSSYQSPGSNVFSTLHTSIGVMFVGVAVLYIAKQATESKDSWMNEVLKRDKLIDAANTEGIWDDVAAAVELYGSKYKIILLWILWIIVGLIFGKVWIEEWDSAQALDFVLSTLSGGGYISLPMGSSKWKYFFTAFFTAIGMPITSISIGLLISFSLISNDLQPYADAISAVITDQELEFMKTFGIDDGDGTIDNREFILLIAMRFGAASPGLLSQLNERFGELDRDRTGYIKYNDLIKGRRSKEVARKLQNIVKNNAFKIAAIVGESKVAPLPATSSGYGMPGKSSLTKRSNLYKEEIQEDIREEEEEESHESDQESSAKPKYSDGCPALVHPSGATDIESQSHTTECEELKPPSNHPCKQPHMASKGLWKKSARKSSSLQSPLDGENHDQGMDSSSASKAKSGVSAYHDNTSLFKIAKAAQVLDKVEREEKDSNQVSDSSFQMGKITSRRDVYLNKQQSKSVMEKGEDDESGCFVHLQQLLYSPLTLSLLAWFLWLFSGTLFYAFHESRSWGESLYYSISVGYGIFWLSVDENTLSQTFTRIHFCIGMIAIGLMMAAFAHFLVDAKTKWYEEAVKMKELEEASNTEGYWDDIVAFLKVHGPRMRAHACFIVWVIVGVIWGMLTVKWPFIQALYFSVSSLATGGLWALPENSPDWYYAFVALYIVGGVPIMAISLGMLANSISNIGGSRILEEKIGARITDEEIEMMESFGIVDDDGSLDAKEFAILTLVRIGALQPQVICMIHKRFEEVDKNNTGSIAYDELRLHNDLQTNVDAKAMKKKHTIRKLGFL